MRVVVFAPDAEPEVRDLADNGDGLTLEGLQEVVGGDIEVVNLANHAPIMRTPEWALLVCNENGIAEGLPVQFDRLGIFGAFLVCKGAGEEMVGLSDEEIALVKAWRWPGFQRVDR